MRIGVLALQGAFEAHVRALEALGHRASLVRDPAGLDALDGLVLPGGESSTHLVLIDRTGLWGPLDRFARARRPVLCTCAGLVLAARRVRRPAQRSFGWLGVEVERNAWGAQVASFEARDDSGKLPLVFIRAPRVVAVDPGTRVEATLSGEPVLVRKGAIWGAAFHPELTSDPTVHEAVFGSNGGREALQSGPRCATRHCSSP